MSLAIYTYSNPYEINNEPYWDSIKQCAHFCVSQTMVNGLSTVYRELNSGQLATVEDLVETLYPRWHDTKTYIEQYTLLTNVLNSVKTNISIEKWSKVKQALRFNKNELLDSIRLLCEMGIDYKDLKIRKLSEEQLYLVAAYKKIREADEKDLFWLKCRFSEKEIDVAVKKALIAKDIRNNKQPREINDVDCDSVIIHGVHQFTPTILLAIEEIAKYKRVILLFNYQEQYKEIYQTWVDVYSCFDINIKSQFNNEFTPTNLLQASYQGNLLGDALAKLACGEYIEKKPELDNISVLGFDNITEFSAYVAKIYEDAKKRCEKNKESKEKTLSYMNEQFYSANNAVNDILKVYFPEQFGERHFLAYPIGHFFVAVTNMWNAENGGIYIENLNDIAECLYSEVLPEKKTGSLITTFNATKNYFMRETDLVGIVGLLKKLKKQRKQIFDGQIEAANQLRRLYYYSVSDEDVEELIKALEILDSITKLFMKILRMKKIILSIFMRKSKIFWNVRFCPMQNLNPSFRIFC